MQNDKKLMHKLCFRMLRKMAFEVFDIVSDSPVIMEYCLPVTVKISQIISGSRYGILRLLAVLVSVLIVFLHNKIPDRRLALVPNHQTYPALYGPEFDPQSQAGNGNVFWMDKGLHKWHCINPPNYAYSCGYSLSLYGALERGVDFSQYRKLKIKLKHQGTSPHIRLSMRNYNPSYTTGDRSVASKFMSVLLQSKDLKDELTIDFNEFTVAEWWIKEYDIPREHSLPEFDNVLSLGIDFVSDGANTIEVQSIELVGNWITSEQLYLSILVFWLILVIIETGTKFLHLYKRYEAAQQHADRLVENYRNLKKTKEKYETLSTTDILTGALNRTGIYEFLNKLIIKDYEKKFLGIILFDIDFFKNINDTRGHDCGDRVLIELAQLVKRNTRDSDLFGRWGGEEFVLICPLATASRIKELAEKLRKTVDHHNFEPEEPLHVTVSMGVTLAKSDEPFEKVFKRLDTALYKAKESGRNKVVYL